MNKHPKDRAARRSAEALALQSALYRQRKVNAKKRDIHEKETRDAVKAARHGLVDE